VRFDALSSTNAAFLQAPPPLDALLARDWYWFRRLQAAGVL
jgi:hypothetical protein